MNWGDYMKTRDFLLVSVLVTGLLFYTLFHLFIKPQDHISIFENRSLATISDLIEVGYVDETFQDNFESVLSDQFVYRSQIKRVLSNSDSLFRNILYKILRIETTESTLKMIGDTYIFEVGIDGEYLISKPLIENDLYMQNLNNRINEINSISIKYSDIDFYVYKPIQIHELDWFDEANGFDSVGREYSAILEKGLIIPYKEGTIVDLPDFKNKYYSTDHHWNHNGSYQGYLDIIKLLGDEQAPIEPNDLICLDDATFYGSFSTRIGHSKEPSEFCFFDFTYPEMTYVVDGVKMNPLDGLNRYLNNNYSRDKFSYHYGLTAAEPGTFKHFYTGNEDKENILFVVDSFARPVTNLLASHFNNSYFIAPRDYYWKNNELFDYDDFLINNDVDKVVFMYIAENYFWEPDSKMFEINVR